MKATPAIASAALLLAAWVAAGAAAQVTATGTVAGQRVETTVDTELARAYLGEYLGGGPIDPQLRGRIEEAVAGVDPLDREALGRLTARTSTDFATLFFAARLDEMAPNRRARSLYEAALSRLESEAGRGAQIPAGHRRYRFAFVPGYGYRKNPEVGADFSRQRRLMSGLGFDTHLIPTDETGTVEANVPIVVEELRRLAADGRPIVVVSTSKGGAEAALALGGPELADVAELEAWISVGGLLRGSPYADRALARRGLSGFLARTMMAFRGMPRELVESLATARRREAFGRLRFPQRLLVVHYVGTPLSGQVGESVLRRYRILSPFGPNDGLTLLADELIDGGRVVTEMGLDHYYRDPALDLKSLALTMMVLGELERSPPQAPE